MYFVMPDAIRHPVCIFLDFGYRQNDGDTVSYESAAGGPICFVFLI